ncbi:unnamed protein product, partial [Allacma fusca]
LFSPQLITFCSKLNGFLETYLGLLPIVCITNSLGSGALVLKKQDNPRYFYSLLPTSARGIWPYLGFAVLEIYILTIAVINWFLSLSITITYVCFIRLALKDLLLITGGGLHCSKTTRKYILSYANLKIVSASANAVLFPMFAKVF